MDPFRIIPVMDNFSIFHNDFHDIRANFDREMKKMEEDMASFTNELMSRESLFDRPMMNAIENKQDQQQQGSVSCLEGMNSPLIQQDGDNKHLKLRFDVSQYKPEEVVVKTVDNKLMVHAKHEEKSDSHSVYREYNREFLLPKGTNPEVIKSSLSKDGVLTVEAPLPALPAPRETNIPIENK